MLGTALITGVSSGCWSSKDTDGLACGEGEQNRALLVGLDNNEQKALLRVAEKSLVVVQAELSGCTLRINVLADCRGPGSYRYAPYPNRSELVVKKASDLDAALPHAGVDFQRAFALFGGLQVQLFETGRLIAPERIVLDRRALRGETCGAATHVVQTVTLGAYGAAAVEPAKLGKVGDLFEPSPIGGHMMVRKQGRRLDCQDAKRSGRRTSGCSVPLRAELVALVSKPPSARGFSIAAGRYTRGRGDPRSAPLHEVDLDAFVIDTTEVSVSDYQGCVDAGRCTPPGKGRLCNAMSRGRASHPVNCVSWRQADVYCRFLGKKLPTEAQWERAAIEGHGGPYPWGADWPPKSGVVNLADDVARRAHPEWRSVPNYRDGFAETAPVGALGPPTLKIRDLGGNVMEWTRDYFAPYSSARQSNPTGPPTGQARVVRGSSFGHANRLDSLAAHRRAYRPDVQSAHIGFRCAQ